MRNMNSKESRYTHLRVNGEIMQSNKTNLENLTDEKTSYIIKLPRNSWIFQVIELVSLVVLLIVS